jgi:hypothetical protein
MELLLLLSSWTCFMCENMYCHQYAYHLTVRRNWRLLSFSRSFSRGWLSCPAWKWPVCCWVLSSAATMTCLGRLLCKTEVTCRLLHTDTSLLRISLIGVTCMLLGCRYAVELNAT